MNYEMIYKLSCLDILIEFWIVIKHIYGFELFIYRKESLRETEKVNFFDRICHVKFSIWFWLIVYFVSVIGISEEQEGKYLLVIVCLQGLLYCTAKEKKFRRSFWLWPAMCTAVVPSIILESVLEGVGIVQNTFIIENDSANMIFDGITFLLMLVILWLDWKYKFSKRVEKKEKFLVAVVSALIAITWISTFGELTMIKKMEHYYDELLVLFSIVSVFLIWTTVHTIYVGISADYYKQLSDINEKHLKESLQCYVSYKDAQIETRKLRHDMKNHLACMQILLQEQKEEELQQYLESFHAALNEVSMEIQTQNDIVDAILNLKYRTAKKEAISILVNGTIPQLPWIESMDWCKIFSNAIDNGIEAIRKCKCTNPQCVATLQIIIKNNSNFLVLHFENPCNKNVKINKNRIQTDKLEKEQHGFGLKNIETAVRKYNGDMQIACIQEGELYRFSLDILIPLV